MGGETIDIIEKLLRFCLIDYSSTARNNGRIPADMSSPLTRLWNLMLSEIEDTEGGLVSIFLMRDEETGEPNYKAILIVYVMPLLTCSSLCFIKCFGKPKR